MARQKHDLSTLKRAYADERVRRLGFKRRRRVRQPSVWLEWCRLRGHPAKCKCVYPEG